MSLLTAQTAPHRHELDDGTPLTFVSSGGPGPEPFPEVRYVAPGPPDLEPIINALDDPMSVSYSD